jgi:antitoxin (DNA-binding transcriptional repressor) of toxin-antitoxin stability system
MEVTISQFRRDLFAIVAKAAAGEPVSVRHKGGRFRIVPESPVDRLSRITPMQIVNPAVGEEKEQRLKKEMQREWEDDLELL